MASFLGEHSLPLAVSAVVNRTALPVTHRPAGVVTVAGVVAALGLAVFSGLHKGWANMRSLHSEAYRRFLARLRRAREDAGLTQVEVAKRLRRPQSYVSKCESGERRVDVMELAQFAALYGKRLEFFVQDRKPANGF